MEIVRTALTGQVATTFFSEFLGRSQSTLVDIFDWELLDAALDLTSGAESTSEDTPPNPIANGQSTGSGGSDQTR